MTKTIERIEREAGAAGLAALLGERLAPTDLQSLLLEVYRLQAGRRMPAAVLADYESNRFVRPASVSPLALAEWDRAAFASLPAEVEAVELSPVAPLATNSAVALVDQNKVVSTSRNTEVVADSTNVLALECALRRRDLLRQNPKSALAVHLAASHRLLRAQQFAGARSFAHFRAFALCSAGRDQGHLRFEFKALMLHIGAYLRALRAFLGADSVLRVALTDFHADDRRALLEERLIAPLQVTFSDVAFAFDDERESGRGYYVELCFKIYVTTASGEVVEVGDGGVVDWTQKLLSNAKERCVISGVGSERICSLR